LVLQRVRAWQDEARRPPIHNADAEGPPPNEKDDFRSKYLQKLACAKVYVPEAERAPAHQTVVIFDWDDTLLCTSFLNRISRCETRHAADQARLPMVRQIGNLAQKLLEEAMQVGQVFIITNAMEGWVQHSAAKWAPDLLPTLQKVKVVSARSRYEAEYPDQVHEWKVQTFLDVQREMNSGIITNLISLGDSDFELKAAHVMSREFEAALIKTIKFRENPAPEELLKQLEVVSQQFLRIVQNARCLKISLQKTEKASPSGAGPAKAATAA